MVLLVLFLIIATLSGFGLATISATEKIFGLTKLEYLVIHVGSGSISILLVLIYIIIYRKWLLNIILKVIRSTKLSKKF